MLSIVQYIYIHTVYMYSFDTILEQRGKKHNYIHVATVP